MRFVYRVDMRLRPFWRKWPFSDELLPRLKIIIKSKDVIGEGICNGKSACFGAEREYCQILRQMLRPFVYRRYIDFSVIQSLRNMKSMISREVRRRGMIDNMKSLERGIREIEFITQVFHQ